MRWLDDELLATSNRYDWEYFLVRTGPLKFCIATEPDSPFQKALDAFYDVTPVSGESIETPVVFIYESSSMLDQCALHGLELSNAQASAKLSASSKLLNWDPVRGLLKYYDARIGQGVFVARKLDDLPSWEWFSPIKEFVHVWALEQGVWLAHAATIGFRNGVAVLLVGPGGSGKSTSCASMILDGCQTCGDDYVLLSLDGEQVFCHAIYRTLKLMPRPDIVSQSGSLAVLKQCCIHETGKSVYFLDRGGVDSTLIQKMVLTKIYGLELSSNQSEALCMGELGYPHFAMSSLGQIPVWIDLSLKTSRAMFEQLPKNFVRVRKDADGLAHVKKLIRAVSL